jgi:uncharacterized protein YndB with AHSA1/START domain
MDNHKQVEVTSEFDVPVEQLYKAWTEPEALKKWWHTTGFQLIDVQNELRDGGKIAYSFENDELAITGEYEKVEQFKQLKYSWNWHFKESANESASYTITVEFSNTNKGSSIHVKQQDNSKEERIIPHQKGWEKGLKDLKQYLSGNADNDKNRTIENEKQQGYREDPEQLKVGGS